MKANADYNASMSLMQGHKPKNLTDDLAQLADLLNANTFATLALAYEQRTATLVALYAADEACAQGINLATGWDVDNWADLAKIIIARLGLDK